MIFSLIKKIHDTIDKLKIIVDSTEASIEMMLWDLQNRISLYEFHLKNGVLLDEDSTTEEYKEISDKKSKFAIDILNYYLDMLDSIYTSYLEAKENHHIGFTGYKLLCLFLFYPNIFKSLKHQIDLLHTLTTDNIYVHSEHATVSHILLANDVLGAVEF